MNTILASAILGLAIVPVAVFQGTQTQPQTQPGQPQPTQSNQPGQQPGRQDDKDRNRDRTNDKWDQNRDGMNRDQNEMEQSTQHRGLDVFVGTWQVTGQVWKEPKGQPESITGVCNSEWVLGRRFVKSHAEGSVGSRPFEGFGVCGYDTGEKKYTEVWIDNMSTGTKWSKGDYDAATKTFNYTGESKDDKGQTVRCRKTVRVTSDTEHTATAYATMNGQSEMKVMELHFRRTAAEPSMRDHNRDNQDMNDPNRRNHENDKKPMDPSRDQPGRDTPKK